MDMLGSWPIFVVLSVLTYAVSVLLQKIILRNAKSDPIAFAIVSQGLAGVVIAVVAVAHGFHTPNITQYWPNILLSDFLYSAGTVCIFFTLKYIEASTFTILFTSRVFWSILAALLFLHETFTWVKLLGAFLIISSIVLISWHKQKISLGKGEMFGLLASLFFGLGFVSDAFIVQHTDVLSYEAISFGVSTAMIALFRPQVIKHVPYLLSKRILPKVLLLSILYGVSSVALLLAYQVGHNAAQIAPLLQTTTIVTVLLSIVFLQETTGLARKSLGAILSFIGVILVG